MWDDVTSALGQAGGLIGTILAAFGLAALARGWYRKTLGRRRDTERRLERLGTNAQLSFFTSVLGDPPAMRRSITGEVGELADGTIIRVPKDFEECIYVDRDFYLLAVIDTDESVLAYSVTTRSTRFHPSLRSPGTYERERQWPILRRFRRFRERPIFDVRLGKTRFAELDRPDRGSWSMGAHTFGYHEAHWLGNPGNYQWYVFAVNDAGARGWDGANVLHPGEHGLWDASWGTSEGDTEFEKVPHLTAFRRVARMNTYAVVGPNLDVADYPTTYGPHIHHVRTLG
jgi:hypothetical protein